jgi:hypothetical protein
MNAMGDMGVHDEDELNDLTEDQRQQLRQEMLRQLQTSPEIRAIINENPQMLTGDSRINEILKRETGRMLAAFKKS